MRTDELMAQLVADGANCKDCPLGKDGRPGRPVASQYHPYYSDFPLAIVGEMPGANEVRRGVPFIGNSGKLLDYACRQAGINRNNLIIANAAACGPVPSWADAIKEKVVACCRPRLISELRRLRPKTILAAGAYALRAMAMPGIKGITKVRGALLPMSRDFLTPEWMPSFFGTFHPAHILRGGDGEQEEDNSVDLLYYFFLYDLVKAWRVGVGEAHPWSDDLDLFAEDEQGAFRRVGVTAAGPPEVVGYGEPASEAEIIAAFQRVVDEAVEAGSVACDVETDALNSLSAVLTAIAFATPQGGFSATWKLYQSVPGLRALAGDLLQRPDVRKVFHNRMYDTIVLPRHHLPVGGPVDDTLLKHHAAFPGLPHKLDQVATQFFIVPAWKDEFRKSVRDLPSLILYNGRDAFATALLDQGLNPVIVARGTPKVYEMDRQLTSIATHMRKTGFFIDRVEQRRQSVIQHARLDYMKGELTTAFGGIAEEWRQTLARNLAAKIRKGDPDAFPERLQKRYAEIAKRKASAPDVGFFKPKAKADLVALFETLGVPVTKWTPKGQPVTDKKAMEEASVKHPIMRKLIHIREAQHLLATYIDGWPLMLDGRVHPDWKTTKISGRWGAGKSQNIPNNVSSWPPDKDETGQYRKTDGGDWICPRENPRQQIIAPTREHLLTLMPWLIDEQILQRAKDGFGRMLVGADQAQLELRIAGFLSGDKFVLGIFERGEDPHAVFAREVFSGSFPVIESEFKALGLKPKAPLPETLDPATLAHLKRRQKEWKRLRDLTKRAEYGGIYGGSAEVIWTALVKEYPQTTIRDVQQMLDIINQKMQGVVLWRNEQEIYARMKREVRELLLGRCRLFPLGHFNPNIVYNFPIQSFAATILGMAMLRFTALTHPELLQFAPLVEMQLLDWNWVQLKREEGFEDWQAPVDLLINGHDSLLVECDEEDAEKATKLLEDAMTMQYTRGSIKMTFIGEAKAGRRWSDT